MKTLIRKLNITVILTGMTQPEVEIFTPILLIGVICAPVQVPTMDHRN